MEAEQGFDCVVVGAGIVGLAHALAAMRAGLRTAVVDRDAQAAGASVRNFGFVTVTGQQAGITWRRARRSRDVWAELAGTVGIPVLQRGLTVAARRPEALRCLEEFAAGPMGEGCRLLAPADLAHPFRTALAGGLYSPHELRVESREAIPLLALWLERQGVTFLHRTAVRAVETGRVETSSGVITAPHVVVCPGPDLVTLFPDVMARRRVTLCKLQMLRVAAPGWTLPSAVMSDLGLLRYLGYADCPSLTPLRARLLEEQPAWIADGIHLIAVQSADGSLVVGDSHHYADTPDPFQRREVDDRIMAELCAVLHLPAPRAVESWIGMYPSGPDAAFAEAPAEGVRLVMVTSGTGASTAFALAEETLADLLGQAAPPHTYSGVATC
jgi:FAD dependent oxidoreductase TIGR03364